MSRKTVPIFVVLVALFAVGFSACGSSDDSSDSTAADTAVTETNGPTTSETTSTESENAAAPSGEAVKSQKVTMADFSFDPADITIQTGGKVIWQNDGQVAHTATAEDGSFDTGDVEPGKIKSETFKEAGTYSYVCSIHPQMTGTITVVDE